VYAKLMRKFYRSPVSLKPSNRRWGYRRVWAYLRFVHGLLINQKRGVPLDEGKRFAGQRE
jgi:hypothetical protein